MSPSGPLILDASAALAWLVTRTNPTEETLAKDMLLATQQRGALVPDLWWAEVANGALVSERRGGDRSHTTYFFDRILLLPIREDHAKPRSLLLSILAAARAYGLTYYDSKYLELALRTGSALATFDRKLADAARKAGVQIFGDST